MKSQGRFGEFSLSKAGFLETTDHTNFMYSQAMSELAVANNALRGETTSRLYGYDNGATLNSDIAYSQGLAHDLPAYLAIKLEAIETRCRQPNMIVLYCPVHLLAPAHC